jgi:quercetin dioxygenase-like cupin family protein
VAIITSKAGVVRANHYHPHQTQHDYLISGKFEFIAKDIKGGPAESAIIEPGDLVMTGPNVAHAMRFLEDSVFLTITDGGRDTDKYAEHTIKFQVI